jgi:hypothetical protein
MKFSLIKNVIGALAPTLGSALGGPLKYKISKMLEVSLVKTGQLELWVLLLLVGLWVIYF